MAKQKETKLKVLCARAGSQQLSPCIDFKRTDAVWIPLLPVRKRSAAAMPPGQFRMILSFKRQAASGKLQASSLTINKYRIL